MALFLFQTPRALAQLSTSLLALTVFITGLMPSVWANPVAPPVQQSTRVGQGEFTYFGFKVYQATLHAPAAFVPSQWDQHALTLTLTYHRSLKGKAIADRSLEEMRRSKPIEVVHEIAWLKDMRECFPDVQEGDRLQGVYQPGAGIRFDYNSQPRCHIKDADFARQFLGIWLHASTSAPDLRAQLLGLSRADGGQ